MPYAIEWTHSAKADVRLMPAFHRAPLFAAVELLRHQASIETVNRKPLAVPLEELPEATWEIRIGDYRAFYEIEREQTVRILRVIFKGSDTTADAVTRGRRRR